MDLHRHIVRNATNSPMHRSPSTIVAGDREVGTCWAKVGTSNSEVNALFYGEIKRDIELRVGGMHGWDILRSYAGNSEAHPCLHFLAFLKL